jgi:hypothetical protein
MHYRVYESLQFASFPSQMNAVLVACTREFEFVSTLSSSLLHSNRSLSLPEPVVAAACRSAVLGPTNWNSFCRASTMLSDWETSGGSRTSCSETAEVSMRDPAKPKVTALQEFELVTSGMQLFCLFYFVTPLGVKNSFIF